MFALSRRAANSTHRMTKLKLESLESRLVLTTFELAALLPQNGGDGSAGFAIASDEYQLSEARSVGDLNGDGIDDLMVRRSGRNDANDPRAELFVVFGTEVGFPAIVDSSALDGTNGFSISNTLVNQFSSTGDFAPAGDFNGDGIDDLLISTPSFYVGAAYVIFGTTSGFAADLDVDNLDGINGFKIQSDIKWSTFGTAVSSAGDFNGDGYDDILVVDSGSLHINSGQALLFFGAPDGFLPSYLPWTYNDRILFQTRGNPEQTTVLEANSAGDLDGDGYDDITVNWVDSDSTTTEAGENYVVFGRPVTFGLQEVGIDVSGNAPQRTAAGDVNGDGLSDLIVSDEGQAHIVFGTSVELPTSLALSQLNGVYGFTIQEAGQAFGLVGQPADFNGDGFDDLLVADPAATANGVTGAGKAYVLFGRSTGFGAKVEASSIGPGQGVVINGFSADHSIVDITTAGDLNGDGLDDLVVNMASHDASLSFVVFGQSLDVITADIDADGLLTVSDLDALQANLVLGPHDPATYDLNGDGLVTIADRDLWLVQAGAANRLDGQPYLTGDANLDGVVDGGDFLVWNSHKFTVNSNWSDGDFNADGVVDGGDFLRWNQNKFAIQGEAVSLKNRVYSDRFVSQNPSGNAVLDPTLNASSEWLMVSNLFGTTFRNRAQRTLFDCRRMGSIYRVRYG